jgi:hypothetical protein
MSATTTSLYAKGVAAFLSGQIAPSNTFNLAFVTSSYTPNLAVDNVWSDISTNEASGSGYTAGGQALTSVSVGILGYQGFAPRQGNTAYSLDQTIAFGLYIYVCVGTGTTAIATPSSFPTAQGQTITDGTVIWACLGTWVVYFQSATPSWNPLSLTGVQYGVIYDTTASDQLLVLINLGSSQTLTGPYAQQPDPTTGWFFMSG